TVSGDPSGGGVAAYEVGGLQFNTMQAAQQAAAISGLAIAQIEGPVAGLDAQMNQAAAGLSGTTSSRDTAAGFAATASAAAAAAGAAASAASGPGSAASAAASAADAR